MIHIAILEDMDKEVALLQNSLEKYAKDKGETIKTTVFHYGESLLANYKCVYDIAFIDIGLDGINGMDTAKKLRTLDEGVAIVFLTSMGQFAIEGYSVDAVDFIVKPFRYYDLKMRLDRIFRKRNKQSSVKFISVNEGKRISLDDLIYVETYGHRLDYHTEKAVIPSYTRGMKEVETELEPFGFCRCSVSALVNMKMITRIDGNDIYLGGSVLPISRGKKKEFLEKFYSFHQKL